MVRVRRRSRGVAGVASALEPELRRPALAIMLGAFMVTLDMTMVNVALIGGSVLCGLAWSSGSLIAFRILQGVGGGMLIPLAQTILAQAAGPDRLGCVMAVIGIPAMLGPVLGPSSAG